MSVKKLKDFLDPDNKKNLCPLLDKGTLLEIGHRVKAGFSDDEASCAEWLADVKKVMELNNLQSKPKSINSLQNAANVKMPIITKAATDFAARAYPEIVKDGRVVKSHIVGIDDANFTKQLQAQRVEQFMNYQLLFQNNKWEMNLDRLLNQLGLIGFLCTKAYYDPVRNHNCVELCDFKDLIINSSIKNLDEALRISHVLHYSLNDIEEGKRAGIYNEDVVEAIRERIPEDELNPIIHLIEQHCFYDLDEDGYEEPYVVTITEDMSEVIRITPRFYEEDISTKDDEVIRIEPTQYFTDYHFLVSPDGKFQSTGFGLLLLHMTEVINTLIDQLIDAGQLANGKWGYIDSSYKMINTGDEEFEQGEFKKIKVANGKSLEEGFFQLKFGEPSSVLYQLAGLLITSSKELSSATEVMTGSSSTENAKTGAIQQLIQQSMTVITAIHRRFYRSLSSELQKLFILNGKYLDPSLFIQVENGNLQITPDDFNKDKVRIIPVADPNMSSDIMRNAQTQFLAAMQQAPGVNPIAITVRMLQNANIPNWQQLVQTQQKPDPEAIKVQAEIQAKGEELELKGRQQMLAEKQFILDVLKTESVIVLNKANALKAVAQADQAQSMASTAVFEQQLNAIQTHLDSLLDFNDLSLQKYIHDSQMNLQQQQMKQQAQQNASNSPGMDQGAGQPSPDQGSAGEEAPANE